MPGDELIQVDFIEELELAYGEYGVLAALKHVIDNGFKGVKNMTPEEVQEAMKELQTINAVGSLMYTYSLIQRKTDEPPSEYWRGSKYSLEDNAATLQSYKKEFVEDLDEINKRYPFVDKGEILTKLHAGHEQFRQKQIDSYRKSVEHHVTKSHTAIGRSEYEIQSVIEKLLSKAIIEDNVGR